MTCQLQFHPPATAKETAASKPIPVIDTPAINPELDFAPKP